MTLERYRQKRDFNVTPEPQGSLGRRRSRGLAFVVQKHAATRLHYDFRLELDGVLLSWAVPKGPSLDPNDKRLAMHVEDHPLEYGDFEGVIPPKQYGAGSVMVWDRGTWTPIGDPSDSFAKGKLKFELHGEKLRGRWNLVKSRSDRYGGGESWLLFKEADAFARLGADANIVDGRPESVLTGRSLSEIASQADRVWHSNRSVDDNVNRGAVRERASHPRTKLVKLEGARASTLPDAIDAQLATQAKSPPLGASWVHEIKYDGYRMLCRIDDGDVRIVSRNRRDWTSELPSLVRALSRLAVESAWLDGEVVVVDANGRSSFQQLQNALSGASGTPITYFAFDLPYLNGVDLRGVALVERKRVLGELLAAAPDAIKYSEHFSAEGPAFLQSVDALGLEGMVSKRADLPYRAGRGPAWQKVKCKRRQELVIGGYSEPEGSREAFGALLLGVHEPDGRLHYAGKVGSGFDAESLSRISQLLKPLATSRCPFHDPPQGAQARRAHWVKPELVAEVSFTEWTDDGTLRHPVFVGLRADKRARDVVRERERDEEAIESAPPAATASKARPSDKDTVAGIALTNPDKVLYPETKLTKRALASYYEAVGEWMLPHLTSRPLTLVRCPDGWDRKSFYQKNADDGMHAAISRVRVDDGDGGHSIYMMAESVAAIVALLQMGALELHPWGSRSPQLGLPDRIVFDLDPDETLPWERMKEAVLVVKALIENLGLAAFLKTTGGKGLHVVVPIEPSTPWEHVKGFTKAAAELLERTFPDRFTSKLLKVSRHGRIFIDYLRNAEGATAVGAYSLRAKANAPVSTPIEWDELDRDVRFAHFNARNVAKRPAKLRADPWRSIGERAVALTPALMAKVGYPAR